MVISMTLFKSKSLMCRLTWATLLLLVFTGIAISYTSPAEAFWWRRRRQGVRPGGRPTGGAVRDECPVNTGTNISTFKALVPDDNKIVTYAIHPTFWFHVPFTQSEELRYAEFMLIYADDTTYSLDEPILFDLPSRSGIVKIQLPESVPGLEPDRPYRWYFSIQCDRNELSRNPVLSGEIERSPQASIESLWPETMMQVLANGPSNQWQEFLTALELNENIRPDSIVSLEPALSR